MCYSEHFRYSVRYVRYRNLCALQRTLINCVISSANHTEEFDA